MMMHFSRTCATVDRLLGLLVLCMLQYDFGVILLTFLDVDLRI